MKKLFSAISAIILIGALAVHAAAVQVDTPLPDGTLSVTNDVTVAPGGMPVEYLVIQNDAAFSNAVTVTATALNGAVTVGTLYSGTLLAAGTAVVYPVRAMTDGNITNRSYRVSGVRTTVTSASGSTNAVDGTVKTLFQSQ